MADYGSWCSLSNVGTEAAAPNSEQSGDGATSTVACGADESHLEGDGSDNDDDDDDDDEVAELMEEPRRALLLLLQHRILDTLCAMLEGNQSHEATERIVTRLELRRLPALLRLLLPKVGCPSPYASYKATPVLNPPCLRSAGHRIRARCSG